MYWYDDTYFGHGSILVFGNGNTIIRKDKQPFPSKKM